MKINTDGVLLGASAGSAPLEFPHDCRISILDVGTGTGVIALMMAQRFSQARVVAVEKDLSAARRALQNFKHSPFHNQVSLIASAFQDISAESSNVGLFDLIVSNPPFFLDSLHNPDSRKSMARHTNRDFFRELLEWTSKFAPERGYFQLVLPPEVVLMLEDTLLPCQRADVQWKIVAKKWIFSFPYDETPVRCVLTLQKLHSASEISDVRNDHFIIYEKPQHYTEAYKQLLGRFFLDF